MRINGKKIIFVLFILFSFWGYSQEDMIISHSRFMQKVNPSAFGMNNINKTGVLYNSLGMVNNNRIESQYFFGAISFDNDNFSIGLDVYSLRMDNTGLINTKPTVSYIYKIQLDNDVYFLPSLSAGFGGSQIDTGKLIFEDQLSLVSGFLQTESQDPLVSQIGNSNYIDLGVSFLVHSSNYLVGSSIKHLNQPNISYNKENTEFTLPIRYSVQGGYEFDINPYDRSIMPRYSTIFAFLNASKMGDNIEVFYLKKHSLVPFLWVWINSLEKRTVSGLPILDYRLRWHMKILSLEHFITFHSKIL